jgi:hypothetical protein
VLDYLYVNKMKTKDTILRHWLFFLFGILLSTAIFSACASNRKAQSNPETNIKPSSDLPPPRPAVIGPPEGVKKVKPVPPGADRPVGEPPRQPPF